MKDIDIADLVSWALVDQQVAQSDRVLLSATAGYMSSTAIVTDTLMLGRQVDCQPGYLKRIGAKFHPDAVTVWDGLKALDDDTCALLIRYGRASSCPDWTIWPELKPKRHLRNHKVVVESQYDATGKLIAMWCPLEGYPSMEVVAETRLTYSRWHAGMVSLKRRISSYLTAHRVTGPSLSATPWAVDN